MLNMTKLAEGNRALREKKFEAAIAHYLQALQTTPALGKTIGSNLTMARQKYRADRAKVERIRVAVCGWELAHNAAGRVYTLAKLYETFADVEIIGSIFPSDGREVWEPIRNTSIPIHSFVADNESRFLDQAIELVAAHPYDIVHLAKPRAPNIFFGILYKLIWDAKVLVDIDDEELAFVEAETPISIDDYLKVQGKLPELKGLDGKDWTRLAVGLAKEFDGVTVSNLALQQRYGGEIIRHARDEKLYQPSPELKRKSREKFGIPQDKKVVLFFGTPRGHKGLLETADAIRSLNRGDVVFAVVGDFQEPSLKEQLLKKTGVDYFFLANQPFEKIPDIVATGDYCVLLQDPASPVSQFQIPAKLSDALGMGLIVLASDVPPFEEVFAHGALVKIAEDGLAKVFADLLGNPSLSQELRNKGIDYFSNEMSLSVNASKLKKTLNSREHEGTNESTQLVHTGLPKVGELLMQAYMAGKQSSVPAEQSSRQAFGTIDFPTAQSPGKIDEPKRHACSKIRADAGRVAVVVHYFYPEIWPLISARLKALSHRFDLFVTAPISAANSVIADVSKDFPLARFQFGPNLGMDIIPFLSLIPTLINERYVSVCKLHTKKGDGGLAEVWRDVMLDTLIGSSENFALAANSFADDPRVCLVGPAALYQSGPGLMYDNLQNLLHILDKTYSQPLPDADWGFFAGTMFWARTEILAPLSQFANFSLEINDLVYKKDGKIEHALERFFGLIARLNSGKVGLLQQRSVRKNDCCLLLADSSASIGKAHIGDVMRQFSRLESDVKMIEESGLFDKDYYIEQCPELKGIDANCVIHYLTQGTYRELRPNSRFIPREYRRLFPDAVRAGIEPFAHYIKNGAKEVSDLVQQSASLKSDVKIYDAKMIEESGLFDQDYYLEQCPELKGLDVDCVMHYLAEGTYRELYPSRYFIPREYRALHPDVVKSRIEPFVHYLKIGAKERRQYRENLTREQNESPFYRYVVLNSMLINWRELKAAPRTKDVVSIVIPVYGQGELTEKCVESILNSPVKSNYEIVCVDNGSDIDTANTLKRLASSDSRIKLVSNAENFNFSLGCNLGFANSMGGIVVFLNNDTTVTPGWLDKLVAPLADDTLVAVQPKLVYPDGTIQCAGVVFSGQSPLGYPLYAGVDQNDPDANKSRAFQAVSAACIALRSADFISLKGFDPTFINGQEDVDLCLRLTHSTNRTCWYEATSLVYHYESKSPGRGKYITFNRRMFVNRWGNKVKKDDYKYYAEDKFEAANWIVDNEEFAKQGIAIYRPILKKLKVSRVYFTWDKAAEDAFLTQLRTVERRNISFYENILVSVVMPTYNRQHVIAPAIESVLAQSHKKFELLVVDDGSTDDTSGFMNKLTTDSRVKYIKIAHAGVSAARNKGLELASGEYVFYLDTDNKWNIDFVRNMLVFLSHGKLAAAYSAIQVMDDDGRVTCYRGDVFDWGECLGENYIDLNGFAHARNLVEKFRFDVGLARMVDWDFILRLTANNRTAYAPFMGVTYYDGNKNSRITRTEYQGDLLEKMGEVIRNKHDAIDSMSRYGRKIRPDWTEIFDHERSASDHSPSSYFNHELSAEPSRIINGGEKTAIVSHTPIRLNLPRIDSLNFRIKIGAPSIAVCEEWGDYHFALAIQRSLRKHGHSSQIDCLDKWEAPDSLNADVVLVLRGLSKYNTKSHQINLMWNISHPDKITDDEYLKYDHIFVASLKHAKTLSDRLSVSVSPLLQCTDPSLFNPEVEMRQRYDVLFVGNSRNVFRQVVKDAMSVNLPISVFGTRWEQFLPSTAIKGEHIKNTELAGYYASAGVVLNDHWGTMRDYGFISNRLFDAAACDARIVSDNVEGLAYVFGQHIATYKNPHDLKRLVDNSLLETKSERQQRKGFAQEVIKNHSFDVRVENILKEVARVLALRKSKFPA
jgi:glycosyltransferase involved in cell wall biosynthesis